MKSEAIFWQGSKRISEMEPISCVIRDRGSEKWRRTNYCSNSNDNGFTIHHTLCEQIMLRTIFKEIKAQKKLSAVYYINKAYLQWCEKSKNPRGNREYDDFPGVKKKSHLGAGESAFDSLINFAES